VAAIDPRQRPGSTRPSSSADPDKDHGKTVEEVELATLGWVHWHNTERLHGYLGDVPPIEFETAHYAAPATASQAA
jgi:transposase InsO family protein